MNPTRVARCFGVGVENLQLLDFPCIVPSGSSYLIITERTVVACT